MAWWKEYVLFIIGIALLCGIINYLVSELHCKRIVRLVCGTFLALAVLGPLLSVDLSDSLDFEIEALSPERYVAVGKDAALKAQEQCIKESLQSYISSKAKESGMTVTSEIFLNEMMEPCYVRINVQGDSGRQHALEVLLEEDLGITKENLVWIWNQKKGG